MKIATEIRFIVPDGNPIELTLDEARDLYLELQKLFGQKEN